jgi:RNA polymerase sigma-70 factor (ECF subfamily)
MTDAGKRFANQAAVRGPWRRYLDSLVQYRPDLHRYCRRLTGNVWDGEDLMQDTLVRVFSLLGKVDANLENPRAYLIRTATNLWIDRVRRSAREQAVLALEIPEATQQADIAEQRDAARALFQWLHPQERAAIVMKDVFDLSLEETAAMLRTSVGAVKSALNRARSRLEARRPSASFDPPPRGIVEKFMVALRDKDLETMRALCAEDFALDMVGGAQGDGWEQNRTFFTHAHMTMPKLGFGLNPRWEMADYEGETVVLGFRTLDGVEGLNEVHRLEVADGKIMRIRCYCFCPETVSAVAEDTGVTALWRPHRSPDVAGALMMFAGLRSRPKQAAGNRRSR